MKPKRIFFITIFMFMALSITVFAELPSIEESAKFARVFTLAERTDATKEEEEFTKYFYDICRRIRDFARAGEYADKFDIEHNIHALPFRKVMQIRKDYVETERRGHCSFGSSAICLKLEELGIENYWIVSNMKPSEEHNSILYRTKSGEWLVADFSFGVAEIKALHFPEPADLTIQEKVKRREARCKVMSRVPLQDYIYMVEFVANLEKNENPSIGINNAATDPHLKNTEIGSLDIRTFAKIYNNRTHTRVNVTVPEHFGYLRWSGGLEVAMRQKFEQLGLKFNKKTLSSPMFKLEKVMNDAAM